MKQLASICGICVLLAALAACEQNKETNTESNPNTQSETQAAESTALTALSAWTLVKPQADEWNADYTIARVNDLTPSTDARSDGKATLWEFYLEVCTGEYFDDVCLIGTTRTFYWQVGSGTSEAKVTSDGESTFTSGMPTFAAADLDIDSDAAVQKARSSANLEASQDENITTTLAKLGDTIFWTVVRGCVNDSEICDRADNFTLYVDAQSGEVMEDKPKSDTGW
jgi:hypothetical protein